LAAVGRPEDEGVTTVAKRRAARQRAIAKGVALGVGLSLIAGACGGNNTTERAEPERARPTDNTEGDLGDPVLGGAITVGLEGETNSYLPGEGQFTNPGYNVANALFDPLVIEGGDGHIRPFLAESIGYNAELTEWSFRLREGITFHDGTTLDANVMKAIFDEYLAKPGSTTSGALADVVEFRVIDDLTFAYILKETNAAFVSVLTGPAGWPFSIEAARAAGPDAGNKPMGTGPFKLQSWTRDDKLVVVRNDDYWRRGLPYLDQITFRPIPDETSRVQSLLTEGIDAMQSLAGATIKEVQAAEKDGFTAHTATADDASSAVINTQAPPFDDKRVRQAWAHAFNQDDVAVISEVDGLVENASQFFSEDSIWYSEKVAAARATYDHAKAKKLLAEYVNDPDRSDGKAVGEKPTFNFQCLADPALLEIAQLAQMEASAVGFDVELQTVEQAALVTNLMGSPDQDPPFSGDFMVGCFRLINAGDPYNTFRGYFGDPSEQFGNITNFTTPELTKLVDDLRLTADFDERYAIVEQIGLIINEEVPVVFAVGTPSMIGVRDAVKNVEGWTTPDGDVGTGMAFGITRWGEVWLEK
jgi:peptide/nickel transport system substrate-binding protein